ncbi:hypothetical protein GCM10009733_020040 [Nonomuraea maheshkhaliensis]|uniref:Uncharacterized protein n=1 Tax=Nonomuraea maheshkhaliensis TaxID=419590 RepID=A0ABP4QZH6_9ACTN
MPFHISWRPGERNWEYGLIGGRHPFSIHPDGGTVAQLVNLDGSLAAPPVTAKPYKVICYLPSTKGHALQTHHGANDADDAKRVADELLEDFMHDVGIPTPAQATTMAELRRMLVGPNVEFDDEGSVATITTDVHEYVTISVDQRGHCEVERAQAVPGEEHVPLGDGLTLDQVRPIIYRALCGAIEASERREAATVHIIEPIPTTEECFRDAFDEGLAPMTLRLALEGIDFTVGKPTYCNTVIHISLKAPAYIRVIGAGNRSDTGLEDLRWHLWRCDAGEDGPEVVLGDVVSTEDAVELIATELNKAKADGCSSFAVTG